MVDALERVIVVSYITPPRVGGVAVSGVSLVWSDHYGPVGHADLPLLGPVPSPSTVPPLLAAGKVKFSILGGIRHMYSGSTYD